MEFIFTFALGFAVIYLICWLLEKFALFCDFSLPQIQEKRYKKKVIEKYNTNCSTDLIGLKKRDLKELHKRATEYAENVISLRPDLAAMGRLQLFNTCYRFYYEKYKNLYS